MPDESSEFRFQPRRELGKTGFNATQLGIGDLADRKIPVETCAATIRRALEAGLNIIDTAPSYEDGYSEQVVGKAIKGFRDKIFVIDKVDNHNDPIRPQIESSLSKLEIEMVDLFVFHALDTIDGWQKAIEPNGAFDQLELCRNSGMLRFKGISSHNPDVLTAAIKSGLCDVVLFPIGPYCDSRFIEVVLPLAKKQNVGTVCFKTFGAGKLLGDTPGYNQPLQQRPRGKFSSGGTEQNSAPILPRLSVAGCLNYTLTIDPDVALLGLCFANEQDAAFEVAQNFTPLDSQQMSIIKELAAEAVKEKGNCWWNLPQ
ncbi:MAG: aldo/keto reductase [Planctomycetes bacterium GWF2_41_51]|nr:MAG: aldo/keto reductase [Planctomycetes bacterium GWF2_41_51]